MRDFYLVILFPLFYHHADHKGQIKESSVGQRTFTTRPELAGTHGMVASTHWLASAAGMAVLESGGNAFDAAETVEALISADEEREHRQLGVVDAVGRTATFTGGECFEWAGGVAGEHYAAQGNILAGRETVGAMAKTFEEITGDLAGRLLATLDA